MYGDMIALLGVAQWLVWQGPHTSWHSPSFQKLPYSAESASINTKIEQHSLLPDDIMVKNMVKICDNVSSVTMSKTLA